jgi:hypothetical protein
LVDVPLATSVPSEGVAQKLPKEIMPEDYDLGFKYEKPTSTFETEQLEIMKGATEPPVTVGKLSLEEQEYVKNISGFELSPEQKAATMIESPKLNVKLPEYPEHLSWKFPLSYAEQAEPLKLVGEQEILETPESIRAIMTAEKLGITPKASMIDPFLQDLETAPTLERPIAGMPYMPKPEVTARIETGASFLPKVLGLAGIVGIQATRFTSRTAPKVQVASRAMPSLKPTLDLAPDISAATMQGLEPITIPITLQEPITKTIQSPRTTQILSPDFPQIQIPTFQQQFPYNPNMELFKAKRKRKPTGWERKYLWEFPVKGPKEAWKAI